MNVRLDSGLQDVRIRPDKDILQAKSGIVAAAVLLACVCQAEDICLRAALNLSLDGKAAAMPIIAFRPGELADMILRGEQRSIRVSALATSRQLPIAPNCACRSFA